jgi:16S rRNA processing protein RimM
VASEFAIVGRVRKPHGIRGDLIVEAICNEPGAVFAPGRRVFAGTDDGAIDPARPQPVDVVRGRPFKDTWLVALRGVRDRNDAETWRGTYLLAEASTLSEPEDGEAYLHELTGMRVVDTGGSALGEIAGIVHLPHGLLLTVRMAGGDASVPFVDAIVLRIDRDARVITIDPPQGLLEL